MKKLLLSLVPVFALACSSSDTKIIAQGTPPDAGTKSNEEGGAPAGTSCTSARKTLLTPVGSVATRDVTVIGTTAGAIKIYIDASAGGTSEASKNPRTYLKLSDSSQVKIDDNAAFDSSEWDIAFKRVEIWSNSGDAGAGKGGGLLLNKSFATVTAADANGVRPEQFFSGDCTPDLDVTNAPNSTFDEWYDYDQETHIPSPKANTVLLTRAADGVSIYAVELLSYAGKPDGSLTGGQTGQYVIQVKKL